MTQPVEMWCRKCKVVYDVTYEGEHIWKVAHPDPTMIETLDGFEPIDFVSADQVQASVFPLCLKVECVIGESRGILSDEPVPINFDV